MNVNWDQLRSDLGAQLATSLQGLVEGAAGDIQAYANAISAELVLALSTGNQEAVRELQGQLRVIAEINRVRLAREKESFVLSLIGTAISAATSGLLAAGANLGKAGA